jgi:hypothetical protein
VIQADQAVLQPQVGRDDIGFSTCGVRGVVVVATPDYMDSYDFSVMLRANLAYGTLKAGKLRTATQAALKGRFASEAVTPAPIKFWIAQEGEGKPISPIKVIPADNKGFILEVADLADTARGIMAMIEGSRMQFAVRYKNQPVDLVVSFSAAMPEIERAPLLKCIEGVTERLYKMADEMPKK